MVAAVEPIKEETLDEEEEETGTKGEEIGIKAKVVEASTRVKTKIIPAPPIGATLEGAPTRERGAIEVGLHQQFVLLASCLQKVYGVVVGLSIFFGGLRWC